MDLTVMSIKKYTEKNNKIYKLYVFLLVLIHTLYLRSNIIKKLFLHMKPMRKITNLHKKYIICINKLRNT